MGSAGAVRRTSTSTFGVGGRNGHDSGAFYARFDACEPQRFGVADVAAPKVCDVIVTGDARCSFVDSGSAAENSVALVVTSPPYFVGKEYETAGAGGVPGSYGEYLQMLETVFANCARVLEPGGRIAVNVANLGRRPYRPLSHDVAAILAGLGLLLRGEIVWRKAAGAGGSAAWGTFADARNPVLRDVSERVIVASKGSFERAGTSAERAAAGLPYRSTVSGADFMASTLDVWEIPAESATRVGHPAPFPTALAEALIELYTFEGDLVLDPFVGSGSTAVAAVRTGRRYVGVEFDEGYADLARARVAGACRAAVRVPVVELVFDVLCGAGWREVGLGRRRDVVVGVGPDGRRWQVRAVSTRGPFDRFSRREVVVAAVGEAALSGGAQGLVFEADPGVEALKVARAAVRAGALGFAVVAGPGAAGELMSLA